MSSIYIWSENLVAESEAKDGGNQPRSQGLLDQEDPGNEVGRNLVPRARDLQGKNRELWDNP